MSSVQDPTQSARSPAARQGAAQAPAWPDPQQGVIEEARRRQRRRRRRLAAAALAGVVLTVPAVALLEGSRAIPSRAHSDSRAAAAALSSQSSPAFNIRLAPALEVGQAGWQVFFEEHGAQKGGEAGGPALSSSPIVAGWGGSSGGSRQWTTFLLTTPNVASILVEGKTRVPTRTLPGLPYGYRAARILTAISPAEERIAPGFGHGPQGPRSLVPLNAQGQPISSRPDNRTPFQGTVRSWEYPGPTPEGSCGLRASGIEGLSAQGGKALSGVQPYPAREIGGQIVGHAFLPCVSVLYHLDGMPLRALILLDAAHPGSRAAALPDFRPVRGAPGLVEEGGLTARREGSAWLIVGQGSGVAQRVRLLRHLNAIVKLGSLVAASAGVPELGHASAPAPIAGALTLRVAPALEAGALGWQFIDNEGRRGGSASCCDPLTRPAQLVDAAKDLGPGAGPWWTGTVITAPQVRAVSVEGRAPVPTRTGGLPYGMRYAVVAIKHAGATPVPFGSGGRRIESAGFEVRPKRRQFEGPYAPHGWSAPSAPPAGAVCELSASGLSGLSALGGDVVLRVKGYRLFESRAFQSCADTYYSLGSATLQAAVLLDAEHPGSRPATLPYMRPAAGASGLFQAPGGGMQGGRSGASDLIAERLPGAWLVVTGGSGPAQQAELLRHLRARIHG